MALIVFFVFVFQLPLRTPWERSYLIVEAVFYAFLLCCAIAHVMLTVGGRGRMLVMEALILCLLVLPPMSAFMAHRVFGQPFLYGLGAQRQFIGVIGAVLVLNALRRGTIDIGLVERAFLLLMWITFLFWVSVYVFVDPDRWKEMGGAVGWSGGYRGTRIHFETVLTGFGLIFYTIRWVREHRIPALIAAISLAGYVIFLSQGRIVLLTIFAAIGTFLWSESIAVRGRLLKYLCSGMFFFMIILMPTGILFPRVIEYVEEAYGSAVTVVLTGEPSGESSADSRITQTRLIWPFVKKHPLLGNGDLSGRWGGGVRAMLGRVYPADLGLLGLIYLYGICGVGIAILPWAYVWQRCWKTIRRGAGDVFPLACKYFIVYYFLRSLLTGAAVISPAPAALFLALIHFISSKCPPMNDGSWRPGGPR